MIIPEFSILMLTFHRVSLKILNWAACIASMIHFWIVYKSQSLKHGFVNIYFVGILQVLYEFVFPKFRILEILNFHPFKYMC